MEKRHVERQRSLLNARVIFEASGSVLDCEIRNISPAGAKLQLHGDVPVPAEFDLDVPHRNKVYRARLIWRGEEQLGVAFVDAGTEPALAPDSIGALERIRELETENAELRLRLRKLTTQIRYRAQLDAVTA